MPIKPLLKLKRIIKGRRLTSTELGYERNPKTGRLEKPGTRAFNEKVAFQEDHNTGLLDLYKKKLKENPTEINKQKLIDRERQLNRRLDDIKRQRDYDLKMAEDAIKRKHRNAKILKINALLSLSNKKITVKSTLENLSKEIYNFRLKKAKEKQKGKLIIRTQSLLDVSREISKAFYEEFDKAVRLIDSRNMTSRDAQVLVSSISNKIRRRNYI
jgi:hypothetical protein